MHLGLEDIINGYGQGLFLMDNGDGLGWYSSRRHALVPLDDALHVPRSLRRALNNPRFETRINHAFDQTLRGCANRADTWISPELHKIYLELHRVGIAHSFETWVDGRLAGSVLGLALGGAFIGESMFFVVPEASKVALVRLAWHLREAGFVLFDAQMQNPHLARFGTFEMNQRQYRELLRVAVAKTVQFTSDSDEGISTQNVR